MGHTSSASEVHTNRQRDPKRTINGLRSAAGKRLKALIKETPFRWHVGQWAIYDHEKKSHGAPDVNYLAHEFAHWLVADKDRKDLPHFGLGRPGGPSSWDSLEEEVRACFCQYAILYKVGWTVSEVGSLAVHDHNMEVVSEKDMRIMRKYGMPAVAAKRLATYIKRESNRGL